MNSFFIFRTRKLSYIFPTKGSELRDPPNHIRMGKEFWLLSSSFINSTCLIYIKSHQIKRQIFQLKKNALLICLFNHLHAGMVTEFLSPCLLVSLESYGFLQALCSVPSSLPLLQAPWQPRPSNSENHSLESRLVLRFFSSESKTGLNVIGHNY